MHIFYNLFVTLAAIVTMSAAIFVVEPANAQKPDRYGDSLPEGAIARLGSVRLRHEANSITGVVFSPDSRLIATATNNSPYIFVFDVATGERVAQFGPDDPNESLYWNGVSLAFENDSQSLLAMLLDGRVERLDIQTGKRTSVGNPSIAYRSVCATSDGRLAAIRDADNKIHIIEYDTLKPVAVWDLDGESELAAFSFDRSGKLLALGDQKRKKFEVWDVAQKKIAWEAGVNAYRFQIALSPSGKLIAYTPGERGGFVVRKLGEESPLLQIDSGNSPTSLAFSPDDATLVTQNSTRFEFWNLAEKQAARKQEIGFARGAYFSPDGKTVALAKSSYAIRLFDAASGEERPQFETHYGEIKAIAVNQDGTRVATHAWDDAMKVWDVATQKPILSVDIRPVSLKAIAITPDGKRVAYVRSRLQIFDTGTGEQLHEISVRSCEALAASPDGKQLAAADQVDDKNGISIFDIESGERRKFLPSEQRLLAICWLPDGKQLIAADINGRSGLWNADTGEFVREFERVEKGGVKSLAVHPNGKVFVSVEGGFKTRLQFYRIDNGQPLDVQLEDYDPERNRNAQKAIFTGDGRYLVTQIDFRLQMWDLKSRKRVARLGSQANFISAFALAGDGNRLVTSGALDHLLVWDLAQLISMQAK